METCFVVMPIGDQEFDGVKISATDLRRKYDDLIKEAILKARPNIEVTRADDVAIPGTISTDIINRIMHSTYMVVDVTYPNPNVFYEMGLRHACRPGTIIIKDKEGPKVPFDISHLRYIEYENTTSGLKSLSEKLLKYFSIFDKDPMLPDNHLLEIARLTKYNFLDYSEEKIEPETKLFMSILNNPDIMSLLLRKQAGEEINQQELIMAIMRNPEVAKPLLNALVKSGELKLANTNRQRVTPRTRGKKR